MKKATEKGFETVILVTGVIAGAYVKAWVWPAVSFVLCSYAVGPNGPP